MGVRKENVFLVCGRQSLGDGDARGAVTNIVVCSTSEKDVRLMLESQAPDFVILSVTSLVVMENTVRQIKQVLAGENKNWQVLVDPMMEIAA